MKLTNYAMILISFTVILEFLGIPTGLSVILNTFGVDINPNNAELINADLENSSFFSQILGSQGALLTILGATIVIGILTRSYDTSLVIVAPIILLTTLLASNAWAIIGYVNTFGQTWLTNIVATIFIPLGFGLIWSAVGYFGGRD